MSGYSIGREVEYKVIEDLQKNGYYVQRAASSKGMADVIAVKDGEVLFVSCKRTRADGPEARQKLLRVAACLPGVAVPLVALKPLRQPLTYRRLTGVGPKEWVAWTPDELA